MLTHDDLNDATRIVRTHVPVTPAYRWPLVETVTQTPTWVKHENATPTGAFKVRGGLVFVDRLLRSGRKVPGLIAATRGNHGQSIAFAGREHGLPVTIVVPEGNSPAKNVSMAMFGADLVVHGRDFQEAFEHAMVLAERKGLVPVPSFHQDLVAGVATGAAELHEQAGHLDVIYVPVGLGSGICAQMAVRDLLGVKTEIVGVVADRAPAHALSFEAGRPVSTPEADTFVDGVATRTPVPEAVAAMVQGVARFVRVSEYQAEQAMAYLWMSTHQMPEPAGALALAGLLADAARPPGATAAIIMSGGNADTHLVRRIADITESIFVNADEPSAQSQRHLTLPVTDDALLVRIDFSDNLGWERLKLAALTPNEDGFQPNVCVVDEPHNAGASLDDLLRALPATSTGPAVMYVVDTAALGAEFPIVVVDLESGRPPFRCIASQLWSVDNNLSIANMDWEEFADQVDADGIFRG